MCKYCNCKIKVDNGHIGERVGGRAYPIFIKRYEDGDFLDGRYWLVESVTYHFNPEKDRLMRQVAINYCPVCGRKFKDNYI